MEGPEDNRRLFDCWSDGGTSRRPCRPQYGVTRPEVYYGGDAPSDTSLHSCNSTDELKQWTASAVCCPAKRGAYRRSRSADGDGVRGKELLDNKVNGFTKPTTQRRLAAQERCAASCPLSDMSDVDSDYLSQPDVDDHQPAMIELVSCDSSFSDCSVPYHELITVSPATQLPTGLVKVSIRPPTVTASDQRSEGDRYNIKFVSHFVDVPDSPKAQKAKAGKSSKRHESSTSSHDDAPSLQSSYQSSSSTANGSENKTNSAKPSRNSSTSSPKSSVSSAGNDSKNKNRSSRTGRNSSTPISTQQSERDDSYDDVNDNTKRGTSNSNSRTARNWRRLHSSDTDFDDESYESSIRPMSSTDDDENWTSSQSRNLLTDMDSEQTDDQEIVMMYGRLREVTHGRTVNNPHNVQLLPTMQLADAEEAKETLFPQTFVTESPPIVDAFETSTHQSQAEDKQCDWAIVFWRDSSRKRGVSRGFRTTKVKHTARKADRTASVLRASRTGMRPYKTNSDDHDRECLSSNTSINDAACSTSEPQLTDSKKDDVDESLSMALVVAGRSTPLHGHCQSPCLTDQSSTMNENSDDKTSDEVEPAAAVAAAKISESVSSSLPHLPPLHQQQQQHHALIERSRTDSATDLCWLLQSEVAVAVHCSELECQPESAVTDQLLRDAATDQHRQNAVTSYATTRSSTMLLPTLRVRPPTLSPPRPLVSCLKRSTSGLTSTPQPANPQQQRKIRFASDVKQRTL